MTHIMERSEDIESRLARMLNLIDVDAHVVEPPDVWTSRLPAKYRDVGPRVELLPAGVPKLVGTLPTEG